jgi:hypothetical protein
MCVRKSFAQLLGATITPIQISPEVADKVGASLREPETTVERDRCEAKHGWTSAAVQSSRSSIASMTTSSAGDHQGFWARKSEQWQDERRVVDEEMARLEQADGSIAVTGEKILELAKKAGLLYKSQNPTEPSMARNFSNCTFDRGSHFPTYTDLFAGQRNGKLAERVGFVRLRAARYGGISSCR